jgi:AbiV family abortive infection protein
MRKKGDFLFSNGSEECLRNSKTLFENAKVLCDHSSFGCAQSLAIISMEEAGKAVILELANLGLVTKEAVKLAMTKHSLKKIIIVGIQQGMLLLGKEMINQASEYVVKDENSLRELEKSVRVDDLERKRQNGFYVDISSEDGAISNNPAKLSKGDALLIIKQVEIYLTACTLLCKIFREWQNKPRSSTIIRRVKIPLLETETKDIADKLDYDIAIVFDEI